MYTLRFRRHASATLDALMSGPPDYKLFLRCYELRTFNSASRVAWGHPDKRSVDSARSSRRNRSRSNGRRCAAVSARRSASGSMCCIYVHFRRRGILTILLAPLIIDQDQAQSCSQTRNLQHDEAPRKGARKDDLSAGDECI